MNANTITVTVTVTHDDISAGDILSMRNPVARALARTLSQEQDVYVSLESAIALEMQPPFRTIHLPREVVEWLQQYHAGGSVEPLSFQIKLS